MNAEEAMVRHYLQIAHDRGGGWEMAMRMMAYNLLCVRAGKPEKYSDAEQDR